MANFKLNTWLKLLAIIAVVEAFIMLVLARIENLSSTEHVVIDTFFLTLFSGLGIWFLIIAPEKKKAERDIFQAVHLLGQEIAAIDKVAIVTAIDLTGNITYINDNFCEATGYSRAELLNKEYNSMYSNYHTKEFFNELWLSLAAGKPWRGQIRSQTKSGEVFWVDSFFVPIFDSENKPCKFVAFQFDVTSEKLAEEALNAEKVKSLHMSRLSAIGEMASGIAHEINNPLTVIKASLYNVDRKLRSQNSGADLPIILETLAKAQTHVDRVVKIINGLRNFSRADNEHPFEFVSSNKIIESVKGLCAEKMKDQQVNFEFQVNDVSFECNVIQIEQVLVNLIINSIDAIAQMEAKDRWIKVEVNKAGEFVEISVTDSGSGISPELATKIMQPFFTTKEVGKGTGLGLSISRGIVENHGGIFYIDSASKNTRFVVQIPLHDSSLFGLIDLDEAINSHLGWRQKILSQSSSSINEINCEEITSDHHCAVGKWINRIEPRFRKNADFIELKTSHTKFHRCAGKVVRRYQQGEETLFELELGSGSEYDRVSRRVVLALQRLLRQSNPSTMNKKNSA